MTLIAFALCVCAHGICTVWCVYLCACSQIHTHTQLDANIDSRAIVKIFLYFILVFCWLFGWICDGLLLTLLTKIPQTITISLLRVFFLHRSVWFSIHNFYCCFQLVCEWFSNIYFTNWGSRLLRPTNI